MTFLDGVRSLAVATTNKMQVYLCLKSQQESAVWCLLLLGFASRTSVLGLLIARDLMPVRETICFWQ